MLLRCLLRNVSDVDGNSHIMHSYQHRCIAEEKWVFRCFVVHVVTVDLLGYHPKLVTLKTSRVSVSAAYRPVFAAQVYVVVLVNFSEASRGCFKKFSARLPDLSVYWLVFRAAVQPL